MRRTTSQLIQLLKINEETADRVEDLMGQFGLDFSECSTREFNQSAREAYNYLTKIKTCATLNV